MILGWQGTQRELDIARDAYRAMYESAVVRLTIVLGRPTAPDMPRTFDEWFAIQPAMSPERQAQMRGHDRHVCPLCGTLVTGASLRMSLENRLDHVCKPLRPGRVRPEQVNRDLPMIARQWRENVD